MPVLHNFVNPLADEPGFLGTKPSDWNDTHSVSIENADVAANAGIEESKLSLNFPTHAPVTLGISNGLSLSGQQLSMGLAGANSTGTLSAQDWNTFNSKQGALTFPLASGLGGTGVINSGTFTNHNNSSVIGGGTIVLGGFTLTVPATGTAALLSTANVFTVNQRISGSTDAVQLRVVANGTQTANLQTWENAGGVLSAILPTGNLSVTIVSNSTADPIAINSQIVPGTNARNLTGIKGYVFIDKTITNPAASEQPTSIFASYDITGSNVTNFSGLRFSGSIRAGFAVTNFRGVNFTQPTLLTSGTVANLYGIYVNDVTVGGTVNYAVFTNAGLNRFGDQLTIDGVADRNQLIVNGFTTQTNPLAHLIDNTSTTNAVRNVLRLEARSTGTAAAGLGPGLQLYAETATNNTYQQQGLISTAWVDATNVTRKAKMSLSAYDTAARLGIEIEASGSAVKLGFFGVTPVVQQANNTAIDTLLSNLGLRASGGESFFDTRLTLPMGEINYFNMTGTSVVIAAQSDGSTNMVKAAPTTTLNNDKEFDNGGANNGRLRYTGATTRTFHVACTISIAPAGANDTFVFGIAKNGTVITASKVLIQATTASGIRSTAMHLMVSLATNDYLELFVGNINDADDCTVYSLNIFAMGM